MRTWLTAQRHDPARGRKVLLRAIGITVAATTVVTVILTVLALSSSADTADRLAAADDVLVGATLLLATIAAVVALLAYAVSTGPPDLQVRVWFNFSDANNPVFRVGRQEVTTLYATQFKQLTGNIQVRNNSSYSAKNPAVIIRLREMAFTREPGDDDTWAVIDFASTNGITAVQWDGGPTYSVHGNSTRRPPDLRLDKLHTKEIVPVPYLAVEILADGYRKEVFLPVNFHLNGTSVFRRPRGEVKPEWV